jgi:hypothetical protein
MGLRDGKTDIRRTGQTGQLRPRLDKNPKAGHEDRNVVKNILPKSPSPFPLPVGERGRSEGAKVTAGDVQEPRGKAICAPRTKAEEHFA